MFKEVQGVEWCLALGGIQMPKTFFRGPSIENVVSQAEEAIANMTGGRLETEWDRLDQVLAGTQTEPLRRPARSTRLKQG